MRVVRRRARRASRGAVPYALAGFAGGLVIGALAWRRQQAMAHDQLFAASSIRRAAAIGWLARTPSVENARLLRDYIRWERRPTLRRRAERALDRLLLALGS
ncbi:MAG: hypothetical protein U5K74_09810 [Gemmatimonadaceae bacterium]|nr:hypothetical protein [Gemmatimonadaceae bacterium]